MYLTKTEPKNPDLLTKSFKFVISKAAQKSIILSGYMMTDLKCSNTLTLTAEKVMIKSYMHLKNVFFLLHYVSITDFIHHFVNLMIFIFWTYDRLD